MSYQGLTSNQIQVIQQKIMGASWQRTKLLNYFRAHNGLIKNVGKGIIKHTTTKWEKLKPGQISAGFQDLPDSHGRLTEVASTLATLATKVVIPVQMVDAWGSNNLVGTGSMLSQTISKQLRALTNQVDQFIAYGDTMKTPLTDDKAAGEEKFTGMMNGFTTDSAGDGDDDNVNAAGDYIATFTEFSKVMKNNGFEVDKYFILSNVDTKTGAEQGNNLYTGGSTVATEYDAMMKREDVEDWIDSTNIENASGDNRIAVTTPYTSEGEPAYRLLQGYDFNAIPLYNGGLGPSAMYEIIAVWSGCIESIHDYACVRSGGTSDSLTL